MVDPDWAKKAKANEKEGPRNFAIVPGAELVQVPAPGSSILEFLHHPPERQKTRG